MKKTLSLILCVTMLCSMFPIGVLAENNSVNAYLEKEQSTHAILDQISPDLTKLAELSKQLEQLKSRLPYEKQVLSDTNGTSILQGIPNVDAVTNAAAASIAPESDFTFNSSTGTITKYNGAGGNIEIPSKINEVAVTSIGSKAFYGCTGLTGVIIPDSVTSIGYAAFSNCSNLTDVTLSQNMESIGIHAFNCCGKLSGITIPDHVTSIGGYAFAYCGSLTDIKIPNSVTSIGDGAFFTCTNLSSITLPSGITAILDNTLGACSKLTSVTIPDGVTTIGGAVFFDCTGLESVTLPAGLTSIGGAAFHNCSKLSSISIPNGVTAIGDFAFTSCTSLTSVTLPNSITNLGEGVFGSCSNLASVTLPNTISAIKNGMFASCEKLNGIIIPDSVTSIGQSAFFCCSSLSSITIPDKVTDIGESAFHKCMKLTNIVIPDSVASIGNYAFSYCVYLENITMLENVTSIGTDALAGCPKLTVNTLAGSYAETYAKAHSIPVNYINYNNTAIEIAMPPASNSDQYSNMLLTIEGKGNTTKLSVNTTESLSYSFYGLSVGSSYRAVLTNRFGDIISEIDNITVSFGTNKASFMTLKSTKPAALTVKDSQGKDVTSSTAIKWYNADNRCIFQGNSVPAIPVGTKLFYTIDLNGALGTQYAVPTQQSYTVSDGDNHILFTLSPIQMLTLKGRITEAVNGNTLQGAVVSISQTLNGRYPKNIIAMTDDSGLFSAQIYNDKTNITVSKAGCINTSISDIQSNFSGSSYDMGEIKLSQLSGPKITLNMTYTYSAEEGNAPVINPGYCDTANTVFTLYNQTQSKEISQISLQYPHIAVLESANPGDVIRLTASSKNGDFKAVTAAITLDNNLEAAAQLDLVQNGSFKAAYTSSANTDNAAIVYDSNGRYISTVDFHSAKAVSGALPAGDYTVIFIAKSLFFNNIQDLSGYASAGLAENIDYIKKTVQIKAGAITSINGISIPTLNESKLYYTDNTNTAFTVNKAKAVTGSFFALRAAYALKDTYKSSASNIKLVFVLPQDCKLVPNSVLVGSGSSPSYAAEGNTITVSMTNPADIVRFCITPTAVGSYKVNAFLQFDINGKAIKQPIGTASFCADTMTINVPEKTVKTSVTVSGTATPDSDVTVYDNHVLVGQTKALANGSWNIEIQLYKPYTYSRHEIYGQSVGQNDIKLVSEPKQLVYDVNDVAVSKVTMINSAHPATSVKPCEYVTVFDFQNPSAKSPVYWYWPSYPTFTFKVDFTVNDPSKISNVYVNAHTTAGNVVALPAVFDTEKKVWIASGDFGAASLPVNVSVSYDCKGTNKIIDKQQINDMKTDISPLVFNDDQGDYLNTLMQDLKNKYDVTISYDSVNKKMDFHTDGIGDYTKTIKDCSGINENDLITQGFTLLDTTDDSKIYFKLNNNGYTIVDFKNNTYMQFAKKSSVNTATDNSRPLAKAEINGIGIQQLYDSINNINSQLNFLHDILSEAYMSFDDMANTIVKNVSKLDNTDPNKIFWLKRASQFKKAANYLKGADIVGGISSINTIKNQLNTLIALYGQLPSCSQADALRSDIIYTGTNLGIYGAAAAANLSMSIMTLIAAPETEGLSLSIAIPCIITGFLADIAAGYIFENKIGELEGRAGAVKAACSPPYIPDPEKPYTPDARPVMDPSGYVYEAVASNRVQGVTTTLYYKENQEDITSILWDAAEYQQMNPIATDSNGVYAWDVPQGWWQVKYEKDGYQTAYSQWLPVPPPQVDVNVGILSYAQPRVQKVNGYAGYIEITFDKYMQTAALTAQNIKVRKNGADCEGTIQLVNAEANPKDVSEQFVSKVRFIPTNGAFTATDIVELAVSSNLKSYAAVNMAAPYDSTVSIAVEPKIMTATEALNIAYGANGTISVSISPKEAAIGKKIIAVSNSPTIATSSSEAVIDNNGNAVIPVMANMTGTAYITLSLEGTDLQAQSKINVAMPVAQKVSRPVSSVPTGVVAVDTQIQLSTETSGATIYYTTDGTCPCSSPTRKQYTGAIKITQSVTILAIAVKEGMIDSDGAGFVYTVLAAAPVANPPAGSVAAGTQVALSTTTPGAAIYYTLDGTNPSIASTVYKAPITITADTTIKAIAVKAGFADSNITTAVFTIQAANPGGGPIPPPIPPVIPSGPIAPGNILQSVSAPAANPKGGIVEKGTKITLSTATADAKIYYTVDGTTPTTDAALYTAPIEAAKDMTIMAIAVKNGMKNSDVMTEKYTIKAETPINRFSDISNYDWAKEAISALADKGIIKGTGQNTFAPAQQIKRADFLLIMVRMLGLTAEVNSNFDDVAPDKYYYKEIGIAKALGLTNGVGNNKFNPEEYISRQDMFVIACRIMEKLNKLDTQEGQASLNQFKDSAEIADYAKADFSSLLQLGFVKGADNCLNPKGNATRAETAVFVYRIYMWLNK